MMQLCVKATLIASDFRVVESEFELVTAVLDSPSNIDGLDKTHLSSKIAFTDFFDSLSISDAMLFLVR